MPAFTSGPAQVWVSTAGSTSNGTWQAWNQPWISAGTASATATWISWNNSYVQATCAPLSLTEEQLAERERVAAAAREANERWQRDRQAASDRAGELLLALLSEEQEQTWRERDWFTVQGSRSGRTYRIRRGYAGNVDLLDDNGNPEVTYCAHPPDVPAEDAGIAQMLALVTDEDAFLAVANASAPRRTLQAVPAPAPGGLVTHETLRAVA